MWKGLVSQRTFSTKVASPQCKSIIPAHLKSSSDIKWHSEWSVWGHARFSVNIPILLRCVSLICANQPEPWDLRSMLGLGHTREACEFWQILENVRIVWNCSISMILHYSPLFSLSPFLSSLWLLLPEKTATYCTKWIARSGNCAIAPHVFRGCAQCCCFARFCQASRTSLFIRGFLDDLDQEITKPPVAIQDLTCQGDGKLLTRDSCQGIPWNFLAPFKAQRLDLVVEDSPNTECHLCRLVEGYAT